VLAVKPCCKSANVLGWHQVETFDTSATNGPIVIGLDDR